MKAVQLMDKGVCPLSRFGHYTVTVRARPAGLPLRDVRVPLRGRARKMLAADPEFEDHDITRGTLKQDDYKAVCRRKPRTVELFGELLGLESTGDREAGPNFQAYIGQDNRAP